MEYEISVIVPVYNGEKYVDTFFDSIVKQSFKSFQLVMVDDGSTDNSFFAIEQQCKKTGLMDNVVLLKKENGGVSSARNHGLNFASGKYIAFVDIDDQLDSHFLLELHSLCVNNHVDVSVSLFARNKKDFNDTKNDIAQVLSFDSFLDIVIFGKERFGLVTSLIKKSLLEEHEISFPVGYKYSEDIYVLFLSLCACKNLAFSRKKMYCYCVNDTSVMHSTMTTQRIQCIELMERIANIIQTEFPTKYNDFVNSYIPRLYWSILWQAVSSFKNYSSFLDYINFFNMDSELKKLKSFPRFKVRASSKLFLFSKRLFYSSTKVYLALFGHY